MDDDSDDDDFQGGAMMDEEDSEDDSDDDSDDDDGEPLFNHPPAVWHQLCRQPNCWVGFITLLGNLQRTRPLLVT